MHDKTIQRRPQKAQQEDRGGHVNARCPRCAKVRKSYPSTVSGGNTSPANGHNDPLGRDVSGITAIQGNGEHDRVKPLRSAIWLLHASSAFLDRALTCY